MRSAVYEDLPFEWDAEKSERTFRERGLDFETAASVFLGKCVEEEAPNRESGEARFISVGTAVGRFVTVVWTLRVDNRRIIAAWPSSRRERKSYYAHYPEEA